VGVCVVAGGGGGGGMHGSQTYTLRKTCRMLIWGSYRPQHAQRTLSH
jgi:hypothetical protein